MKTIINHLRNKSEEEKKQWVKIFAIVATALVVLVWILLRYVLFVPHKEEVNTENTTIQNIDTLYQESSDQFNSLRNDFEETPAFFPDFSVPEEEILTPTQSGLTTENEVTFEPESETQTENESQPEAPQNQPTEFFNS